MKKTALVISSGGASLAAIGVIEEMERQGYVISSIAGCSIGSLIGGMYASGNLNKFKSGYLNYKKDVFKLMDFTFSSQVFSKEKSLWGVKKDNWWFKYWIWEFHSQPLLLI